MTLLERSCAVMLCAILSATGCAGRSEHTVRTLPAPANATAFAVLDEARVAVLAGTAGARGVFIIDTRDGRVERSFGVGGHAETIASRAPNGPLLLGVADRDRGRNVGAVETWSLDGRQTRSAPTPGAVRALARAADGSTFVAFEGRRGAIALSRYDAAAGALVGRPVPLPADSRGLAVCRADDEPVAVTSAGPAHTLRLVRLRTGTVLRAVDVGEAPTCDARQAIAYALQHVGSEAQIGVFSLPRMSQSGLLPVSANPMALAVTRASLLVLARSSHDSVLGVYPKSALAGGGDAGS